MKEISNPILYFKPEFMPPEERHFNLPTKQEFDLYARWCVFKKTHKRQKVKMNGMTHWIAKYDIVFSKENTYAAALKLCRTPATKIMQSQDADEPAEGEFEQDDQSGNNWNGHHVIAHNPLRYKGKEREVIKLFAENSIAQAIAEAFLDGKDSVRVAGNIYDWSRETMRKKLPDDMFAIYELAMDGKLVGASETVLEICKEIMDKVLE